MKPLRLLWTFLALGVSGCLVDLYGGDPRIQLSNQSHRWTIRSVGLGDGAKPGWSKTFDPAIAYGGLTQAMDLPVAGRLNLFLRVRDTSGADSLITAPLSVEAGDFRKLQMVEDSTGEALLR
jgi:hypothetical protein